MAIFKSREAKLAEEEVRLHAVLASLIPVYEKVIFQRLAIEKEVSDAEGFLRLKGPSFCGVHQNVSVFRTDRKEFE